MLTKSNENAKKGLYLRLIIEGLVLMVTLTQQQLQRCNTCGQIKPLNQYPKHPEKKSGYSARCKSCTSARNHIARVHRQYNVTPEDYNALFVGQKGRCAICGNHQSVFGRRLCLDHDHKTGEYRGLLCHNCNMAMGVVDKVGVDKLKEYLDGGL